MRNAILHLPETRTASERRQVLRAAIPYMDLDDRQAQRAVNQLRTDVESLRRHLSDQRLLTRS